MQLYLATHNGIVIAEHASGWQILRRGLQGRHVNSVIAREGMILAGTPDGIFRSDDEGQTWRAASGGLSQRHVRWLAYHPDISDCEFAGTEPAAIFVSTDGANTWREAPEIAQLRQQHRWFLPYSPGAGCVRGFAFHGARAYAAVEVGGVLRSDDGGDHWQLAAGSDGNPDLNGTRFARRALIYPDVHSILTHPSSPERVFAPTGGGFYGSFDGGTTWQLRYDCYCRAAWVDLQDVDHMILGPADHVEVNGRIEETRDGGATWRSASAGLTVPWPRHMVERFTQVGPELFAVLSNGQLLSAPLAALEWQVILPEVSGVNAVAAPDAV